MLLQCPFSAQVRSSAQFGETFGAIRPVGLYAYSDSVRRSASAEVCGLWKDADSDIPILKKPRRSMRSCSSRGKSCPVQPDSAALRAGARTGACGSTGASRNFASTRRMAHRALDERFLAIKNWVRCSDRTSRIAAVRVHVPRFNGVSQVSG